MVAKTNWSPFHNPQRVYSYDNPEDGECREIRSTEEEIYNQYWSHWCLMMYRKFGTFDECDWEECLLDWITVNWAEEVKNDCV